MLAAGKFKEALDMFPNGDEEMEWTPESLAFWISSYGYDEPYPDGRKYKLTSLLALDNAKEIIEKSIEVSRELPDDLTPDLYLGTVDYDDVPLDGEPSDLTARFNIKKVGTDQITLEFLDIHVL